MKKQSLLTIIIASIVMVGVMSCVKNNTYTVSGELKNETSLEGEMIYLTNFVTNQSIDSTVVTDGKFVFKGNIDTAIFVVLNPLKEIYSEMVLEPGDIVVDTMNWEMSQAHSYGTPLNDKLNLVTGQFQDNINYYNNKGETTNNNDKLSTQERQTILSEFERLFQKKHKEISLSFIGENSHTIISAVVLKEIYMLFAPREVDSIYNTLGDLPLNSALLNNIKQELKTILNSDQAIKNTDVGHKYTNFTIKNGNPDGGDASLSDYVGKGKIVLVDFWASWCGPCLKEIPTLKEIHKKYSRDVTVLSVAVWDKHEASLKAIKEHNTTWAQIINAQTIPTEIYGITGIPHIMLIGKDGTIIARNIRGSQIERAIKENL